MKLAVDANILIAAFLKDATAILSRIEFVPEKIFIAFIKKALSLVAHAEDAPYIALSLALKIPLWSNDSELKEQSAVTVLATGELIKLLK